MERRYELLSVNAVRSLGELNAKIETGHARPAGLPERTRGRSGSLALEGTGPSPTWSLVVDELADLMMTVQSEIEKPLTLLAQKARAIGIHLLVATQRPSVNVITGLIKANFPTRVAFRVAQKVDSRTILDQNGADALLGQRRHAVPAPREPRSRSESRGPSSPPQETERLIHWYREQASFEPKPRPRKRDGRRRRTFSKWCGAWKPRPAMEEGGLEEDAERDERFWEAAEV